MKLNKVVAILVLGSVELVFGAIAREAGRRAHKMLDDLRKH